MVELSRRGVIGGLASVLLVRPALALPDHAIRVEASHQRGSAIVIEPLSEPLFVGDIITIEGLEAYNARYGGAQGRLREFVITARAEVGQRVLHFYPHIVPRWEGNAKENHYATVCSLPARGARITKISTPQGYWRVSGTGGAITYTRFA